MASRCINPQCKNQSSYFGAGALYALQQHETTHPRRHTQYLVVRHVCSALRRTNRRRGQGDRNTAILCPTLQSSGWGRQLTAYLSFEEGSVAPEQKPICKFEPSSLFRGK